MIWLEISVIWYGLQNNNILKELKLEYVMLLNFVPFSLYSFIGSDDEQAFFSSAQRSAIVSYMISFTLSVWNSECVLYFLYSN